MSARARGCAGGSFEHKGIVKSKRGLNYCLPDGGVEGIRWGKGGKLRLLARLQWQERKSPSHGVSPDDSEGS